MSRAPGWSITSRASRWRGADFLTDPDAFTASATLIPHEFTHSWNGKFRRPADMWTPAFNSPQPSDMVWAYEGLTEYWSVVLAARSGLLTPAQYRASLASVQAQQNHRTGRAWRSLQDTATSAQLLYFNGAVLDQLPARHGLLPGGRAAVAGCRHEDPPAQPQSPFAG